MQCAAKRRSGADTHKHMAPDVFPSTILNYLRLPPWTVKVVIANPKGKKVLGENVSKLEKGGNQKEGRANFSGLISKHRSFKGPGNHSSN